MCAEACTSVQLSYTHHLICLGVVLRKVKTLTLYLKLCSFPIDPTRITVAPSNMDVSVGESVVLPCQAQHDPLSDITFTWYFNGVPTDLQRDGAHFEKVGGVSCALSSCPLDDTWLWHSVPNQAPGTYVTLQKRVL